MKIHTNNVPREVIHEDSREFVRYKGSLLDLGDFVTTTMAWLPLEFARWDGYVGDSFFSGLLIRWARDDAGNPDFERVIVGWYTS